MDRILDKLEAIHKDIQDLKTKSVYVDEDLKEAKEEIRQNSEFRWKTKGALIILSTMVLPPFISFVNAMIK